MGMLRACSGVRVLDFSRGMAGSLATLILADFGAEVTRVEPRGGDPDWDDPSYLLLNRGKRSIDLDARVEAERAELLRLVGGVDVVVDTSGPGRAEEDGIGYDALASVNPALVYCSITAFGPTGPLAGLEADDGLVMAKAGVFRDQHGWYQEDEDGRRPVFRVSKDGSYFAGMLAVQGIIAALRARDLTGEGQRVETSLLEGLLCRQAPGVGWLLRDGEELPAGHVGPVVEPKAESDRGDNQNALAHHRHPRRAGVTGMLAECKDGRFISHALTEPHFFPAWIKAIGFDWIWEDDRFKGAPFQFVNPEGSAILIELIEARFKERTAAEWMQSYLATGNVCADVVETTQEALSHPQMVEAGYLVEVDDPRVGRVLQVGPLARIPGAPASVRGAAPVPGEHTELVKTSAVEPLSLGSPSVNALRAPLEGVTIVETAFYYASPFAERAAR